MTELATLKTRLNGAFLWLTILSAAAGIAFLFLIGAIRDVSKDTANIQAAVSAQAATADGIKTTLGRVEDKLDKLNDTPRGKPPH